MTTRREARNALMSILALGFALVAQVRLQSEFVVDGAIFYLAAVFLFLWSTGSERKSPIYAPSAQPFALEEPAPFADIIGTRRIAAIACVFAALYAFVHSGHNQFTRNGVLAWWLACGLFLYAFWQREDGRWRERLTEWRARLGASAWHITIRWPVVALILIMLLAVFFRVYRLDATPAEMTSDHAEKLLDVNDVLNGMRPIFFPRNTGREAMQFYLTAFLIRVCGIPFGFMALKVGTAIVGILAVLVTFFLARLLFNEKVGLLASLFMATSKWHVSMSRIGLRHPFGPLWTALPMLFVFRAMRYNRRNDFLLAGFFLGAGLHTYIPIRVVPLLIVIVLTIHLLIHRRVWAAGIGKYVQNSILLVIMCALVFLPLGRYMLEEPKMFWSRVLTRSTDAERAIPGQGGKIFLDNVKNGFLAFNVKGDVVWLAQVPGKPLLEVVAGALFVLGLAYLLFRLFRFGEPMGGYLLVCLFVMLLPSTLSIAFPGENPSAVRMGGAIPFVFAIVGVPLVVVVWQIRRFLVWRAGLLVGAAIVLLLGIYSAQRDYKQYFVEYDQHYRQSSWNTSEIGGVIRDFVNSVGDMQHAFVKSWPHWVDNRNVGIVAGNVHFDTPANVFMDIHEAAVYIGDPNNMLYILHPDDAESLAWLEENFPNGQVRLYRSKTPGKDFVIYFVPGQPVR